MDLSRKNQVRLSEAHRQELETLTRNGRSTAKQIRNAQILLLADQEHPQGRYHDAQIGRILHVHPNTVARTRIRWVRQGLPAAVNRKVRATPPVPPKLDGTKQAYLAAICCSDPPAGHARWTLSLLVDEVTKRHLATSICRETVRQALKKTPCSPGASNAGASPNATWPASWPRWKTSWTSTPPPTRRRSR